MWDNRGICTDETSPEMTNSHGSHATIKEWQKAQQKILYSAEFRNLWTVGPNALTLQHGFSYRVCWAFKHSTCSFPYAIHLDARCSFMA
jgi:hypothetical protein